MTDASAASAGRGTSAPPSAARPEHSRYEVHLKGIGALSAAQLRHSLEPFGVVLSIRMVRGKNFAFARFASAGAAAWCCAQHEILAAGVSYCTHAATWIDRHHLAEITPSSSDVISAAAAVSLGHAAAAADAAADSESEAAPSPDHAPRALSLASSGSAAHRRRVPSPRRHRRSHRSSSPQRALPRSRSPAPRGAAPRRRRHTRSPVAASSSAYLPGATPLVSPRAGSNASASKARPGPPPTATPVLSRAARRAARAKRVALRSVPHSAASAPASAADAPMLPAKRKRTRRSVQRPASSERSASRSSVESDFVMVHEPTVPAFASNASAYLAPTARASRRAAPIASLPPAASAPAPHAAVAGLLAAIHEVLRTA
jgi:hypothetical protein